MKPHLSLAIDIVKVTNQWETNRQVEYDSDIADVANHSFKASSFGQPITK